MIDNWKDIKVFQYQEIVSLDTDNEDLYGANLLSILLDIDVEDLDEYTIDEYNQCLNQVMFISKPPKNLYKDIISIEGKHLHKIDLQSLTVGEFIDLENLIMDVGKNLNIILSILYRLEIEEKTKFHNQVLESYGDWIFLRAPLFDEVNITDVYGVISEYLKHRVYLFDTYKGLFNDNEDDDDTDESSDIEDFEDYESVPDANETGMEKRRRLKEEATDASVKKWGWDSMLLKLAGGDGLKVEEVTHMSIIMAFNILSIKKELDIE